MLTGNDLGSTRSWIDCLLLHAHVNLPAQNMKKSILQQVANALADLPEKDYSRMHTFIEESPRFCYTFHQGPKISRVHKPFGVYVLLVIFYCIFYDSLLYILHSTGLLSSLELVGGEIGFDVSWCSANILNVENMNAVRERQERQMTKRRLCSALPKEVTLLISITETSI